jgi:hypothetical protein
MLTLAAASSAMDVIAHEAKLAICKRAGDKTKSAAVPRLREIHEPRNKRVDEL